MTRSFRAVGALALVFFVFAAPVSAAPFTYPAPVQETFPAPEAPQVTAASWILYDESTDTVIAELNADEERAMASVTKIMTGLAHGRELLPVGP